MKKIDVKEYTVGKMNDHVARITPALSSLEETLGVTIGDKIRWIEDKQHNRIVIIKSKN
jgi:hypothetical protein